MHHKISSCKNLCLTNVFSNDFKISCINYYLKTIDMIKNMFLKTHLEKTKNNTLLENGYNLPLINNILDYFITTLNSICKISFSNITKISFLNTHLMKMHSLQEILSKFVISKFIFKLFLHIIFSLGTLCKLDFVYLKMRNVIHGTFFEINQVLVTFMDLKYMSFKHLKHFSYEKYG